MNNRRFSPPWTVEALDGGFKIVDANGQTLAYVYGHADARDSAIAKGLSLDEARRIASNIAKLPELLGAQANADRFSSQCQPCRGSLAIINSPI